MKCFCIKSIFCEGYHRMPYIKKYNWLYVYKRSFWVLLNLNERNHINKKLLLKIFKTFKLFIKFAKIPGEQFIWEVYKIQSKISTKAEKLEMTDGHRQQQQLRRQHVRRDDQWVYAAHQRLYQYKQFSGISALKVCQKTRATSETLNE